MAASALRSSIVELGGIREPGHQGTVVQESVAVGKPALHRPHGPHSGSGDAQAADADSGAPGGGMLSA
jgi:hypothetical protein